MVDHLAMYWTSWCQMRHMAHRALHMAHRGFFPLRSHARPVFTTNRVRSKRSVGLLTWYSARWQLWVTEQIRGVLPSACALSGCTAIWQLSVFSSSISRQMATPSRNPSLTDLEVQLLQTIQVNPGILHAKQSMRKLYRPIHSRGTPYCELIILT